jgi:hypothetical protein
MRGASYGSWEETANKNIVYARDWEDWAGKTLTGFTLVRVGLWPMYLYQLRTSCAIGMS